MVSAFIGSPGCGKTTALAWVARRATRKRNKPIYISGVCVSEGHTHVFTNFEFPGAYKLDYEDLGKYRFEDSLILLDEMTMLSDSRDYKTFEKCKKMFWSQHRKFGCSIVWASQAFDDADKKIRNITDNYFMIEKMPLGFSRFVHIEHFTDVIDYKILSGYRYGRFHYFRPRSLYKLFDSYATVAVEKESLPLPPLNLW